ncbi:Sec-independent protein translocase protein TatB [Myxococcaceae bacterium GXIMD 01537]
MFNIGAGEMVLILVAALLVLGPQRLPELARAIGKFMREFRRHTDEVRNVVEREFYTMDQDFNREPPRPTTPPTAVPQDPVHMALPPPAPIPELGASLSRSPELEPAAPEAPAPVPHEPMSEQAAEPHADAPAPVGAEPEGLPRLSPLPGTVARNAPKPS